MKDFLDLDRIVGRKLGFATLSFFAATIALVNISIADDAPTGGVPVITSPLNATTTVTQSFTYQFTATGTPPLTLTVGNLPPGLGFNSALGAILGQPTAGGIFPVTLRAMNAQGTDTEILTLRVEPVPATPTPSPTPTGTPSPPPSPTPCNSFVLNQNFDSVTAPALPAGWVASFTPGAANCTPSGTCNLGTNWATSATTPDTVPNAAFHNDPSCVVDSRLDTPAVTIPTSGGRVSFRNNYNTEGTFDGGVLEISINGGTFTDIITAGGTFVTGGYNATIDTGFLSPIAGRLAWSGNSGGYITTTVNLPTAATGQSVRLRFRMASDCGVAGVGWRVDTVTVFVPVPCPSPTIGPSPTPTATAAPPILSIISGASATGRVNRAFSFQVVAKGATTNARLSATNLPPGLTADPVTGLILGTTSSVGSFLVTLVVTDGPSSATATLQLTFTADPALPVITSLNSVSLTPGVPFSYQIQADANVTSYFLAFAPSYLQFNPVTGVISGTFPGSPGQAEEEPDVSGGIVTNVQLFGSGNGGTGTLPLTIFLAPTGVTNIATRLAVGTGENVLIGGFIIQGNAPKKVVIRAIGPSLTQFGVPNALADPTLELRNSAGGLIFSNDNWRDNPAQEGQIIATGLQPTNNLEGAILAYLDTGSYTAIVSGKNNGTGNALAEVYDLGTASLAANSNSKLGNIATRGTVLSGDSVMIGGFIIFGQNTRVVVRAIGPSLLNFGISGALLDPTLMLKSANGTTLLMSDDWQDDPVQAAEIQQRTLAPNDPRESALVTTLPPGQFTAIVSGKGGTTGVALVEVYSVQ